MESRRQIERERERGRSDGGAQRALKFSGIFTAPRAMPIGNRTTSELTRSDLSMKGYGRKNGATNLIGDAVRSREIHESRAFRRRDRTIRSDLAKYSQLSARSRLFLSLYQNKLITLF